MQTYREFRPTQFGRTIPFGDERDAWFVASVLFTRNATGRPFWSWYRTLNTLQALDPKKEDHQIHRFGDWAIGWFEIILTRPGSRCAQKMRRRERAQERRIRER